MEKVNAILNNPKYINYLKRLENYEVNRKFCKHNMKHFLDLARIAYIMVLEDNLNYSKEIIYAIGLLHDIGRVLEYEKDIPHHKGSVIIAKELLKDSEFKNEEIEKILEGIEFHRTDSLSCLGKIIYESDKLSRDCYNCEAVKECYWDKDKKNMNIRY